MEHIPRDVLAAWMAVESFSDAKGECWAGNRALARRMNLGPIASAQRALLKLEEYGIMTRHDRGGNRRALALLRRVSAPITGPEWAALMERGEARGQERSEPRACRTGHRAAEVPVPGS